MPSPKGFCTLLPFFNAAQAQQCWVLSWVARGVGESGHSLPEWVTLLTSFRVQCLSQPLDREQGFVERRVVHWNEHAILLLRMIEITTPGASPRPPSVLWCDPRLCS